ncbi:hypothetical protein [Pyxidicoccus xibeiensis]|uniref:hypothetical protein n=1 Tax=Pyxidicoccus xibeiensis TaxID=2906759 RepID=UPI0020A7CA06|nr:hypothetical protein [Pyxidicoccus xibeiensis]MCP3142960.1 hypothetical protein [Pyxidicoccus xibeiensis]
MLRRALVPGGLLVALTLSTSGAAQSATPPSGRQFTPPWYNVSPEPQPDFVYQQSGAIGFDPFVNDFAWNTFIALNWPASGRFRGVPDRSNIIGGVAGRGGEGGGAGMPNGPTVWETYKDTDDIYLNPPTRPAPFNAPETIPPACQNVAKADPQAAKRTLVMVSKTSDVLSDVRQAFTHAPLIDLNGELVWYEVKVNETYFDFVVGNGYYDSRKQPKTGINFPAGANDARGLGAIRVKAAWKVLGDAKSKFPDDPKRFYAVDALVFDKTTGKCTKRQMGLVGLHIVQKTQTFPRYVWATFEHVDNAPTQDEVSNGSAAKKKWNFYNPASNAVPNQPPKEGQWTTPVQVVREVPITGNPASANTLFRPVLAALRADNVWQNYQLVAAQWGGPNMSDAPTQPKFLANTTMETYLQPPVEDPGSPHGCINCHNTYATSTDGDFQLTKAAPQAKQRAKAIVQQSMRLEAAKK